MTRRPIDVVAALPHGPWDPLVGTPTRAPGSVRRTTCIDQIRAERGEPQRVVATGRDLHTAPDGTAAVVDEVRLDAAGIVTAIEADPPDARLEQLVGGHVSQGLRRRITELLPEQAAAATLLHQLLDDLPMANLISGYGWSREQDDFTLPPGTAERLGDLCAGWATGGTMLGALDATGVFPIPIGPPAPGLSNPDDPLAWHELPELPLRSVRRRRRLDLLPGDPSRLDVHFRDSHLGADGPEEVLHEYAMVATLEADLTVRSADAVARVLPWPECPGALGSAARVVGQPVAALRDLVASDFKGTSTCTHLNDVLRSVAGATALAAASAAAVTDAR